MTGLTVHGGYLHGFTMQHGWHICNQNISSDVLRVLLVKILGWGSFSLIIPTEVVRVAV
jgi:hypothetical protein